MLEKKVQQKFKTIFHEENDDDEADNDNDDDEEGNDRIANPKSIEFEVDTWPNPSERIFNIRIKTNNYQDQVNIKVFDMRNRLIKVDQFNWNDQYSFGDELQAGIYYIRISQRELNKTLRVMKRQNLELIF